jgi:hypothetical protein
MNKATPYITPLDLDAINGNPFLSKEMMMMIAPGQYPS